MSWIPVNEEMPDAETEVLVTLRDMSVEAAFWDVDCWRYLTASKILGKVTHWQPYPQPPTEEEEQ